MKNLGEIFRDRRQEKNLTYEDITRDLKIKLPYIKALEDGNFSVFPSIPMMRGFVRNYAVYLGLNPAEALAMYDNAALGDLTQAPRPPKGIAFMSLPVTKPRSFFNPDLVITFLLISGLLGSITLFVYTQYLAPSADDLLNGGLTTSGESAVLVLPTPTLAPTETPTPLPSATPLYYTGVAVELVISDRSWIQILADGNRVFDGFMEVGEQRRWDGEKSVAIRAGNAGGVEVYVNGQNRGIMGEKNQVIDQLWEKVEEVPGQPAGEALTATLTPVP